MKRVAALLAFLAAASSAHASLTLCNRTGDVVYAATAAVDNGTATVRGWVRIIPGACRSAIDGDLAAAAYFLYAKTSPVAAQREWGGNVPFCAKSTDFSLRLPVSGHGCPSTDLYTLSFTPISTHHMRSWVTTFQETPDFPTMADAGRAGLQRLLRDLHLRAGKGTDAAVAAFRQRMHLSRRADIKALFDALETEALKSAVPPGYTICNDTSRPVWAALGEQKGAAFVSTGWWTVAAGACAPAIARPLSEKSMFLHVDRTNGPALVTGRTKFCIATKEFEIQGRERCAARGFAEAGFAETRVHGPGYLARITELGLSYGVGTSK